ncbi:hypothetical protein D1631_12285 [Chryseobacterium nematophagum]|uniref:Uncharacterized protein n=2 Tax=Chryseobacterium nematophagum TaxID=2305228 RepID=A0A3M7TJ21_9FLAO|nr:hypothetical protein D1631_12285 [Chryseobacterium nematophagum]
MKKTMNNQFGYLMKNILFTLFFLIISININGCKKEKRLLDAEKITSISDNYSEIKIEKIKIEKDSRNAIYELRIIGVNNVFLNLNFEKETAILEIDNQKIITDFNFTYDITTEDAIGKIKILINDESNLIFLFPVITEEYLTFQILKYNKLMKTFSDSGFHFETHDDISKLYMSSKATLSERNNSYLLKIGSYQFKGNFQPKDKIETIVSHKKNNSFDGNYNFCFDNKREDSIKSETCYEISINSNNVLVDANTSVCKGKFIINETEENEINIKNDSDLDCAFKLKRESGKYFIKSAQFLDQNWQEINKER